MINIDSAAGFLKSGTTAAEGHHFSDFAPKDKPEDPVASKSLQGSPKGAHTDPKMTQVTSKMTKMRAKGRQKTPQPQNTLKKTWA